MDNRNIFNTVFAGLIMSFSMGVSAQALYVTPSGDVGIGTDTPSASLNLIRNDKTAQLKVTDTSATIGNLNLLQLENTGGAQVAFKDTTRPYQWDFIGGRDFKINATTFAGTEFVVTTAGNLDILGILTENSDRNSKQRIEPVDGQNILEKLKNLEIAEWSYKDTPADRHVGPMAQDFYAVFGLGHTDTGIATLDSSGIALAAIKALIEENSLLKERLSVLESQQAEIQAVVIKALENQQEQRVLTNTVMN